MYGALLNTQSLDSSTNRRCHIEQRNSWLRLHLHLAVIEKRRRACLDTIVSHSQSFSSIDRPSIIRCPRSRFLPSLFRCDRIGVQFASLNRRRSDRRRSDDDRRHLRSFIHHTIDAFHHDRYDHHRCFRCLRFHIFCAVAISVLDRWSVVAHLSFPRASIRHPL